MCGKVQGSEKMVQLGYVRDLYNKAKRCLSLTSPVFGKPSMCLGYKISKENIKIFKGEPDTQVFLPFSDILRTIKQEPSQDRNAVLACSNCGKHWTRLLICSVCKFARYCSKECQKENWKEHKKVCRPPEPKETKKVYLYDKK